MTVSALNLAISLFLFLMSPDATLAHAPVSKYPPARSRATNQAKTHWLGEWVRASEWLTHDEARAIFAVGRLESRPADTVENIFVQLGEFGNDALVHELDDELGCAFGDLVIGGLCSENKLPIILGIPFYIIRKDIGMEWKGGRIISLRRS
jgi:hypothetical protein